MLVLLGGNTDLAPPGQVILRSSLVLILGGLVLFLFFWLLLRDRQRAAFLTSFVIVPMFAYGHIVGALGDFGWEIGPLYVGKRKFILGVSALGVAALSVLVVRTRRNLSHFTAAANVAAVVMTAAAVSTLLMGQVRAARGPLEVRGSDTLPDQEERPRQRGDSTDRPDIYYIILDGYARADVLEDLYDFDNSPFLSRLEDWGFFIASESRANYAQTLLSLASSLNMAYIQDLLAGTAMPRGLEERISHNALSVSFLRDFPSRRPLMHLIQTNEAARLLERLGYRFVALTTGYGGVQFSHRYDTSSRGRISEFEELLIGITPLPDVIGKYYSPWQRHRGRVLRVLEELPVIGDDGGSTFVFAHVVCPHPPFVFDAEGGPVRPPHSGFTFADGAVEDGNLDPESYVRAYRDQVAFVNDRLAHVLERILSKEGPRPILVLQGDHGPSLLLASDLSNQSPENLRERMPILNALHFPRGSESLYPHISPVNTFRVMFNEYFETKYELLEDISYFSTWEQPYEFAQVAVDNGTDSGDGGQEPPSLLEEP